MKTQFEMPKLSSLAIMAGLAAAAATMPVSAMAETGELITKRSYQFECRSTNVLTKGYTCTIHGKKLYAKASRGNKWDMGATCNVVVDGRNHFRQPISITWDTMYRGKKAAKKAWCRDSITWSTPPNKSLYCENKSSNHFIFNVNINCPTRY